MDKLAKMIIKFLMFTEYLIHVSVAIMLIIATFMIFALAFWQSPYFSDYTVLNLISSALLMLIVKEVMWTVIKFFKKQPFGISSFLFIGIISAIREMLYIEVLKSVEKSNAMNLTMEMAVNALIILVLVGAYALYAKSKYPSDHS